MECSAVITQIVPETTDTKTFRLMPEQPLPFLPGQFIMVTAEIDGKPVTRAFSISSSPLLRHIDITIKAEINGNFSKFANNNFKIGDKLRVKGPYGNFTLADESQDELLFVAAGSGISPFRSMLQYIFKKQPEKSITLLLSNKTEADIIFKQELEQYAKEFTQFKFIPIITRDSGWNGRAMRIDSGLLRNYLRANTQCYLCGPPMMVENLKQQIMQLGVDEKHIKTEKYG